MAPRISIFNVGCGDQGLVKTDNGKFIIIDINVRAAADDPDDDTPDVITQLKERLPKDGEGRHYAHAMELSHPDEDHCRGLKKHFYLGPLADYPKDSGKIIIREMWSSPIIFRRAKRKAEGEGLTLCEDAKAWAAEARRRVKKFRENGSCADGDGILILGEDIDGKTDDLGPILVKVGETWSRIDSVHDSSFTALLLAPIPAEDDEEDDLLSKNNSSVISRMKLASGGTVDACRFLTGGDAEVAIWERVWNRNKEQAEENLGYDLLLSPHHCSWHSLSWDSWSQMGEDAQVSEDARSALGQPRDGARVIASSKTITDDDADPPCIRAKREYEDILNEVSDGVFICIADEGDGPVEFDVKSGGLEKVAKRAAAAVAAPSIVVGRQPVGHG